MKVTAISDLHGNLIDIEPCDLLLICGDISPLDIQRDYIQMTKWIFNEFQEWIMKIDCPTIILTPGNHDFWFEKMITQPNTYLFNKLTILIDGETYELVNLQLDEQNMNNDIMSQTEQDIYFEADELNDIAFVNELMEADRLSKLEE